MVRKKTGLNISFGQSLLWLTVLISTSTAVTNLVELLFVDFVHGNPHRSQNNAIAMMLIFTPIMAIIAGIGVLIVFTLPLYIQTVIMQQLSTRFGDQAYIGILLSLPMTAIITWYCFDYLTPSDLSLGFDDPNWSPYQHGLTTRRYLGALAVQVPATLFCILYFGAGPWPIARKYVVLSAFILAITAGTVWGYLLARQQYQFL